jgi:hypothetical protein
MLALWEALKQWIHGFLRHFKEVKEPMAYKRREGFKVYEVVHVTQSRNADPQMLRLVEAVAAKYRR